LQADSILPVQQGTQGWDRYAYVNNNPVNRIDQNGNTADWIDWFAGAATQFVDDMTFGMASKAINYFGGDSDKEKSDLYLQGKDAGRVLSSITSFVETSSGISLFFAGLSASGSTLAAGAACTVATGGICAIPAAGAISIDATMVATGALMSFHGVATGRYQENNPVNGMENKLNHIFNKQKHNLDDLVDAFGGQQEAYDAVDRVFKDTALNFSSDVLKTDGIPVTVGGFDLIVKGSIVNGIPTIGTFYRP